MHKCITLLAVVNVRPLSFRPIDLKVGSGDPQGSLGEIKGVLPGNLMDLFVSVSQSVQMGPNIPLESHNGPIWFRVKLK